MAYRKFHYFTWVSDWTHSQHDHRTVIMRKGHLWFYDRSVFSVSALLDTNHLCLQSSYPSLHHNWGFITSPPILRWWFENYSLFPHKRLIELITFPLYCVFKLLHYYENFLLWILNIIKSVLSASNQQKKNFPSAFYPIPVCLQPLGKTISVSVTELLLFHKFISQLPFFLKLPWCLRR